MEIEVPRLTREVSIVFLADVHASRWVPTKRIRAAVQLANAAKPDLVLLGGDYVTGDSSHASESAAELGELKAPLGTFAVLGNHDYWARQARVRLALETHGIRVLDNESLVVHPGGDRLALVAVSDTSTGHADVEKAFRDAPAGVPLILVSHNPDVVYSLGEHKPDLVLCGHTHGGQVAWLGKYFVDSRFGSRHPSGLVRYRGTPVYVTRGVGAVFPPLRIACPPEVTVVLLRPSAAESNRAPTPGSGLAP